MFLLGYAVVQEAMPHVFAELELCAKPCSWELACIDNVRQHLQLISGGVLL